MSTCSRDGAGGPMAMETAVSGGSPQSPGPPCSSSSCSPSPERHGELNQTRETGVKGAKTTSPCGLSVPHVVTSGLGAVGCVGEPDRTRAADTDGPIISTCCGGLDGHGQNGVTNKGYGQEHDRGCCVSTASEGTANCVNGHHVIKGYYADRKGITEFASDNVGNRPTGLEGTHTTVDCYLEVEREHNDISAVHCQGVTGVTINDFGHLHGDEEGAAKLDVASINDFSDTSALLVRDELATSGGYYGSSGGAASGGSGRDSGGCTPPPPPPPGRHVGGSHPNGPATAASTDNYTHISDSSSRSARSGTNLVNSLKRKKSARKDKEKSKHHKTEKVGKAEMRRCASIDTIMEFDENFHGEDGGLDSPASDCTSLFSLGSDAEVCLREVLDGLGDTGSLGGCSSTCSTPPLGEATALRWSHRRGRHVRAAHQSDKSDYQELRQDYEPTEGRERSHFTVEVDGQEYSPNGEVAVVEVTHEPRVAESSFMDVNEAHSTSTSPVGVTGAGSPEGFKSPECSGDLRHREQNAGLSQSDGENLADKRTVPAQRPEHLNLKVSKPSITDSPYQAGPPVGSMAGAVTPGQRCCTCGQTVPNTSCGITDNANNGDSVNSNIPTLNDTTPDAVIEVQATIVDGRTGASGQRVAEQEPQTVDGGSGEESACLQQELTGGNPSYIDALQREKQRCSSKGQSLAPPLHDNLRYHAFFLYHNNDRDWVLNVMEKLESPTLGFKCCCHERDLDCSLSLPQAVLYGMKNSVKTIVVLSPDFVTSTWSSCEVIVSELDMVSLQRDILLVMLQDCDMPNLITDMPYIDASKRDWWTKLLATLALPDDTPMTEETVLSMSSSLVGLNPGLQSGHLLHSIKSKCLCCGRELVDPTEVPDELIAHGVQIPPEEYCHAIRQLMCETKFQCHIWCYNMPVAMLFFTLFLGLCLVIIPIIETKYMFSGTDLTHPSLPTPASKGISVQPSKKQTGLEYVHGAVVWLCVLTVYMLCTHLARRKMKDKTYRRLSQVNTVFIKYNLLVGVENLGLADCNKYYLHFFYFELGPCLAYLQELVDNLEDVNPCYTNQAYLQELLVNLEECTPCYTNQVLETDGALDLDGEDHDTCNNTSERINVLEHPNITNVSIQAHAEDLLLDHSGEFINMLITKKLDRPRKQRHVKGAYCLCQFVEQRVYKMIV